MPKPQEEPKSITLNLDQQPQVPDNWNTFKGAAQELQVIDDASFRIAESMVLEQDRWDKSVDAFFENGRSLAHKTWKWFLGQADKYKAPMEVKSILVPKMKAYREAQRRAQEAEQARLRAEAAEAERLASVEAQRILDEANRKAQEIAQKGNQKLAETITKVALQEAENVVFQAELNSIPVVPVDQKPEGGPGESYPWMGEVVDVKQLCLAIGQGRIPLEYLTPVRGKGEEPRPLVEVNMTVLNHIAKRWGREDIGIPGCRGKRDLQFRFASARPLQPVPPSTNSEYKGEDW